MIYKALFRIFDTFGPKTDDFPAHTFIKQLSSLNYLTGIRIPFQTTSTTILFKQLGQLLSAVFSFCLNFLFCLRIYTQAQIQTTDYSDSSDGPPHPSSNIIDNDFVQTTSTTLNNINNFFRCILYRVIIVAF